MNTTPAGRSGQHRGGFSECLIHRITRLHQAEEARAEAGEAPVPAFVAGHGHGALEQRPENSVYYHPTLNPSGTPPPGKPQRYRTAPALPAPPAAGIPVPKPPPLPKGPAPPRSVGVRRRLGPLQLPVLLALSGGFALGLHFRHVPCHLIAFLHGSDVAPNVS